MPRVPSLVFIAAFLILTPRLHAQNYDYALRVLPAQPDSHDSIRVVTYPSCTAGAPEVSRRGAQVLITFEPRPGYGCIATWAAIPRVVHIGVLPGGTYEIVMIDERQERYRTRIDVRGVDPFELFPPGAPTTGGLVNISEFVPLGTQSKVFVDGVEARLARLGEQPDAFVAPPHKAGIVDVEIVTDRKTYVARHAFKYYDAEAAPDPFVFEPLLFPVAYEGKGAGGAEWKTENVISASEFVPVLFHAPPCSTCSARINSTVVLENQSGNDGRVLHVGRGQIGRVGLSSRVRDTSRNARSAGTAIPVVGREQFRGHVLIANVPSERRYRAMVRVWGVDERESEAFVGIQSGARFESMTLRLAKSSSDLPFASADLTQLLAKFPEGERLTVNVRGRPGAVWAILSLTNNETHEVTVLAPPIKTDGDGSRD